MLRPCLRRLAMALLLASVVLLAPSPAAAEECTNCWLCFGYSVFGYFCEPVEQGAIGQCNCRDTPCQSAGTYCTVIWVTP